MLYFYSNLNPFYASLFLSPLQEISDATDRNSNIVVWKVFDIGDAQRQFDLNVPTSYGAGVPEIGFGCVNDSGLPQSRSISCTSFEKAPAILNDDEAWTQDTNGRRPGLAIIRNTTTERIAVGTVESEGIEPFLLVERTAFRSSESHGGIDLQNFEYQAQGDLYLHVFRSHGYSAGRYGGTLVSAIAGDDLYPGGIPIKKLRPLTSWRISSAGSGKLRLEITENRKEDITKFKHQVVIKKSARG